MSGTRALQTNLDINRDSSLIPFDLKVRTRIVYGDDSIDQLGLNRRVDFGYFADHLEEEFQILFGL